MISSVPLVTVVIPAFRAEAVLGRALASVTAQSFSGWEALVVDDASPDLTGRVIAEAMARDSRIVGLRQARNSGAAVARNCAIARARGRYISFLDADDEWLPQKLERQLSAMERERAEFSFTGFWRAWPKRRRQVHVPKHLTHPQLLRGNVVGCLTAIYDRQALGRVYMPDLRMRQDYALWLKILRRTGWGLGVNEALAVYHVSAGSLSSNRLRASAATWALYREQEGLSRTRAAQCLTSHLVGRLLR